ncbi:hypothetical protein AVDCRST_MAG92-2648 [uncultured Coleofasciculus sp.]|uniref:Uncharacterized protein n=1 Tax=uncultured Coleofasciculus sp. TaxID=1267456 RepID=A0A6J4IXA4_9CYAN|nr:hypothetical protein AVDCRST_MAG92-2648 [uncultured Coleofasciculus sp.]
MTSDLPQARILDYWTTDLVLSVWIHPEKLNFESLIQHHSRPQIYL